MSVGRICVREVDLVAAGESIHDAACRMAERQVGTLIVLDDAKRPIGVVTDRDLVQRVLARGSDPRHTTVGEVMTRDPRVIAEESPIEVALTAMRTGGIRRLPVVNRAGELVGILSLADVLALLAEEFRTIGRIVERRK